MDVQVRWLAVILATASSMVVGGIWYAKGVFGNTWQQLVGLKDKDMKDGAARAMGITVIVSFITAYILAHMAYITHAFFKGSYMGDALSTAFWLWLGFTATRMITHDVFEHRRKKITLLAISHELVTLLVMAAIIGWLHP